MDCMRFCQNNNLFLKKLLLTWNLWPAFGSLPPGGTPLPDHGGRTVLMRLDELGGLRNVGRCPSLRNRGGWIKEEGRRVRQEKGREGGMIGI